MITLIVISLLNELDVICLHTCIAMVYTQQNGFKYCYLHNLFSLTLPIRFYVVKWFQVLLYIIKIQLNSVICLQTVEGSNSSISNKSI